MNASESKQFSVQLVGSDVHDFAEEGALVLREIDFLFKNVC